MKSKCSDNLYYRSKELVEDRYNLMEQMNVFYSKRSNLQYDIAKEIEEDSSEEVFRLNDKVKECDPLIGFMHPDEKVGKKMQPNDNGNISQGNANDMPFCKFHSNCFCKHGQQCRFIHQINYCNAHIGN